MTLLTICQSVAADLGVNLPRPPVFGSQVPVAQRLFAQARRAAQSLYRRAPWVELVTEHTFTASGISDYPLPADFGWMVDDTLWERSRYWALRGAMSPQKWQLYKSSIYGRATIWRRWRIRLPSGSGAGAAAMFSIDPQISSTDNTSSFVFEYVSKNWCVSNIAGQAQTMAADWTCDNDDSVLDEWLIELDTRWRMLRRLGLDYSDDQDEAEREIDKAVARNGGGAILDLVPAHKRDDFIGQYTLGAFPPIPPPDPLAAIAASRPRLGPPGSPPPPSMPLLPVRPVPLQFEGEPAVRPRRSRPTPPGIRPAAAFIPPPAPVPGPLLAPAPALVVPVPVVQGAAMPARDRIHPQAAWRAPPTPAPPSVVLRPPGEPLTPSVPRGRFPQPPMSDL
jgi:hypothetical protein